MAVECVGFPEGEARGLAALFEIRRALSRNQLRITRDEGQYPNKRYTYVADVSSYGAAYRMVRENLPLIGTYRVWDSYGHLIGKTAPEGRYLQAWHWPWPKTGGGIDECPICRWFYDQGADRYPEVGCIMRFSK